MMDTGKIVQISNDALRRVYDSHQRLGHRGLESTRENQFGESTLEADWEAEETVIKTFEENKIPITIISEEHGKVDWAISF